MTNTIAPARIPAVTHAIQSSFKCPLPNEFIPLTGGYSSSQTYRFILQQKIFILRVMGLDQAVEDRATQIQCLKIAAKASIAPTCHYANAETGIIIMDYIQPAPLLDRLQWLHDMATLLLKLHSLPQFPSIHQPLFSYIEGLINELRVKHCYFYFNRRIYF